ncbi:protease HtpX [Lentibacillus sp. CBA3610]|uniref:protease HtpX n=1 Tax=Lentibacillus sp. CBA3610 TaxID=2518176 RepID=UPI001595C928|nr:protease HtpX [Lentibacillus sp. CBA3610]QKY70093.1 protease HtpX [Lentibacillus sp. CBA3610]
MAKRLFLYLLTNILVLTTIGIVFSLIVMFTGVSGSFTNSAEGLAGINYGSLLIFSLLIGFIGSFLSLGMSRIIAKKMMRVKVLDPNGQLSAQERNIVDKVHRLSRAAGLMHMPEVGIYQSREVNAFATGPTKKRSLVAVSSGLLNEMDDDAVEGVIAHEIAHVANGDMVTMTLLQGIVNTFVVFLSRVAAILVSRLVRSELQYVIRFISIIIFQIVFSILGSIVVSAFSRWREYRADQGGADLAGRDKMAHALRSLKSRTGLAQADDRTDDSAVQTMKINTKGKAVSLFSSHPPIEDRIARLEQR